jgi:hypothetical protein
MHSAVDLTTLRRPRETPIWQLERRRRAANVRKYAVTHTSAATWSGFAGGTSPPGKLKPGIPPMSETDIELASKRNCDDAIDQLS